MSVCMHVCEGRVGVDGGGWMVGGGGGGAG